MQSVLVPRTDYSMAYHSTKECVSRIPPGKPVLRSGGCPPLDKPPPSTKSSASPRSESAIPRTSAWREQRNQFSLHCPTLAEYAAQRSHTYHPWPARSTKTGIHTNSLCNRMGRIGPARAKGGNAQSGPAEGCYLRRHIHGPAAEHGAIALAPSTNI
jgi:hypothetical protein